MMIITKGVDIMRINKFTGIIELEDGDKITILNRSKTKCIVASEYADNIVIEEIKFDKKEEKSIYLKEINQYYCTHCQALHTTKEDADKCCD